MRIFLPLFLLALLLVGCDGDYRWRDDHRGVLKSVGGYGRTMVVTFADDRSFKLPIYSLSDDCDQWLVGQEFILQTERIGSSFYWRFKSAATADPNEPQHPSAEKIPSGGR